RTRNTTGYDCSSGADDTQNGGNTKSPRTPWTTDMTKPNTQTGRSVPSSSQSTAASRCRGRGGPGGTAAGSGRDAVARSGRAAGAGAGCGTAGGKAAVWIGCPQRPQNFSPGSFDAPHAAHSAPSAAPHSAQKRRSGRLSRSQDGQRIAECLACGDYHAGRTARNGARGEKSIARYHGILDGRPPSAGGWPMRDAPTMGPSCRKSSGLVDAPGRRVGGAKGENPHCRPYLPDAAGRRAPE